MPALPRPEPTGPHIDRLRDWIISRDGLSVSVSGGDPRDGDHMVTIRDDAFGGGALIQRKSRDHADTAALYVISGLEKLGIVVP